MYCKSSCASLHLTHSQTVTQHSRWTPTSVAELATQTISCCVALLQRLKLCHKLICQVFSWKLFEWYFLGCLGSQKTIVTKLDIFIPVICDGSESTLVAAVNYAFHLVSMSALLLNNPFVLTVFVLYIPDIMLLNKLLNMWKASCEFCLCKEWKMKLMQEKNYLKKYI